MIGLAGAQERCSVRQHGGDPVTGQGDDGKKKQTMEMNRKMGSGTVPMPADSVGFVPSKMFQGPTCSQAAGAGADVLPAPAATNVGAARQSALIQSAMSDLKKTTRCPDCEGRTA